MPLCTLGDWVQMSFPFYKIADDDLSSIRSFLYKLLVAVTSYIKKVGVSSGSQLEDTVYHGRKSMEAGA